MSLIPGAAVIVAVACAAASARRVWFAANATALHPDVICDALGSPAGSGALRAFRVLVARDASADWERDLLDTLAAPPEQRVARINEQLTELDYRIKRWVRVPRVCASISSSVGFLLATLLLRTALSETGDVPIEVAEVFIRSLVGDALTVGAMGIVGTAFCIGAQSEARRIAKATSAAGDRLVEALEALLPPLPTG